MSIFTSDINSLKGDRGETCYYGCLKGEEVFKGFIKSLYLIY